MKEPQSLAEMGENIYQKNKDWLEREYMGKIVAICKEGVAGVGEDVLKVYKMAKEKHIGPFYFRRVGPEPSVGYLLVLF